MTRYKGRVVYLKDELGSIEEEDWDGLRDEVECYAEEAE